jgi:molybdopterin synthase catalytic subunit
VAPFRVALQQADFDVAAEVAWVKSASRGIGAVVVFLGTSRDETDGKGVLRLEFEAYPEMAERELAALAGEATERFGLISLAIVHRTGVVPAGGNIVLIAAAAGHRPAAFDAARWCIDELKRRIPIWKKEHFTDGSRWVKETP